MSLFIGNISKSVNHDDLEDAFKKFGPCKYRIKNNYAFVDYDNENEAEDAKEALHQKDFSGQALNIEWSKKSSKYDETKSNRPASKKSTEGCHRCGKLGHFARECKSEARRSRSPRRDRGDRGRRGDRGDRYRSRSPRGYGRRSRSRSPRDIRRSDDRDYRNRDYRRPDERDRRDRRDTRRDRSNERRDDDGYRRDNRRRDSSPRDNRNNERGRSPLQQPAPVQERQAVDVTVAAEQNQE